MPIHLHNCISNNLFQASIATYEQNKRSTAVAIRLLGWTQVTITPLLQLMCNVITSFHEQSAYIYNENVTQGLLVGQVMSCWLQQAIKYISFTEILTA